MKFSFDTTTDFEDRRNRRILGYIYNEFNIRGDFEDNPAQSFIQYPLDEKPIENTAPIVSEVVVTTSPLVQEALRRSRKPKVTATAAELHQALKAISAPSSAPSLDADTKSDEDEPFDLMEMVSSAKPAEPKAHLIENELVNKVRQLMMERGHVWMRNVLEEHKKISKTIAELPNEYLEAILANPDRYNGAA